MSRTVTAASLRNLSTLQLRSLYAEMQLSLTQTEAGSPQRREALASLQLISQALQLRYTMRPGF